MKVRVVVSAILIFGLVGCTGGGGKATNGGTITQADTSPSSPPTTTLDIAASETCIRTQEIADYNRIASGMPVGAYQNPSEEDMADYARVKNAAKNAALPLQSSAVRVGDAPLREGARFIAQAVLSGSVSRDVAARTPEIVEATVERCQALGHPLTGVSISNLPW